MGAKNVLFKHDSRMARYGEQMDPAERAEALKLRGLTPLELMIEQVNEAHRRGDHKQAVKVGKKAIKPAWFNDTQQLKRMADRVCAAIPDEDYYALCMRSRAYSRLDDPTLSADDLRLALRAHRLS